MILSLFDDTFYLFNCFDLHFLFLDSPSVDARSLCWRYAKLVNTPKKKRRIRLRKSGKSPTFVRTTTKELYGGRRGKCLGTIQQIVLCVQNVSKTPYSDALWTTFDERVNKSLFLLHSLTTRRWMSHFYFFSLQMKNETLFTILLTIHYETATVWYVFEAGSAGVASLQGCDVQSDLLMVRGPFHNPYQRIRTQYPWVAMEPSVKAMRSRWRCGCCLLFIYLINSERNG